MSDKDITASILKPIEYHSPRNLITKVTRISDLIKEPLRETLRQLIELHPVLIDGFHNNLRVDFGSSVGGTLKRVQYEPMVPHMQYRERLGKPIQNAFTKLAELNVEYSSRHSLLNADFDVLFIEPDVTGQAAVSAWHCRNMTVERLVGSEACRDLRHVQSNARNLVDVYFDCSVERGVDVLRLATETLKELHIVGAQVQDRDALAAAFAEQARYNDR